jgi:DDE_Tnp_1-associated
VAWRLSDTLVIAICAVIRGAEGWEDIEEYGKAQAEWFEEVLDLPHGIPRDDTFRRVLSRLDADELTQCFISWSEALSYLSSGDIVAIDGKTLRHSFDHAAGRIGRPVTAGDRPPWLTRGAGG